MDAMSRGRRQLRTTALLLLIAAGIVPIVVAQHAEPKLPPGPTWGNNAARPEASNVIFATADGCAQCHSVSPKATALRTATGADGSPHGLWQATMMANSFRDPYWRAQVSREIAEYPERREEIQALCLTCHGPMAHHTARLGGVPSPEIADAADDPLAVDGVSCTVCHQAWPGKLGTPDSFSGNLDIRPGRRIFGPYERPMFGPMRVRTGYTAAHGPHIQRSDLCGSCHTLVTTPEPGAAPFHEQTPFLEWRNSVFSDEGGVTEQTRTCQECHMADLGTTRIARNTDGRDFNSPLRPNVRSHAFVGGNAFMLDLLRENAEELGVTAPAASLERTAALTRVQLNQKTADIAIRSMRREAGHLVFDVRVENRAGHKFPSAYPSRRAWLHVHVVDGQRVLFCSGGFDADGRLEDVADERGLPHYELIDDQSKVQVYETVAMDLDGQPTTLLTAMASKHKDNRLLPLGWTSDGPHADVTAPYGVGDDPNFAGGEDTVTYKVRLPSDASDQLRVVAWLNYQSIPPAWVDPLRGLATEEAERFVRMYDAMDKIPERVAFATAREPRTPAVAPTP